METKFAVRFKWLFASSCASIVVAPLAVPQNAHACSASIYALIARDTFPTDGATNVPLNAHVVVRYQESAGSRAPGAVGDAGAVSSQDVELRHKGGDVVATVRTYARFWLGGNLERSVVSLVPNAALEPNAEYEVLDRRPTVPCDWSSAPACTEGDFRVFAHFRTGSVPDTTPPTFAGLTTLNVAPTLDTCDSSACCGPYSGRHFSLGWSAATEETGPKAVLYHVYGPGSVTPLVGFIDDQSVALSYACARAVFSVPYGAAGDYRVHAIDWAGNEDKNAVVMHVTADCDGVVPEAGNDARLDAGDAADADADAKGGGDATSPPDALMPPIGVDGGTARDVPFDETNAPRDDAAPGVPSADGDGCSCRVGGRRGHDASSALATLGIVAGLLWSRRKRSR